MFYIMCQISVFFRSAFFFTRQSQNPQFFSKKARKTFANSGAGRERKRISRAKKGKGRGEKVKGKSGKRKENAFRCSLRYL